MGPGRSAHGHGLGKWEAFIINKITCTLQPALWARTAMWHLKLVTSSQDCQMLLCTCHVCTYEEEWCAVVSVMVYLFLGVYFLSACDHGCQAIYVLCCATRT